MHQLLLKQLMEQVTESKGVLLLDPKSSSPEYIKGIVEVAKKHGKLNDVIIAPIASLDDYEKVSKDDRMVLMDNISSSFSLKTVNISE